MGIRTSITSALFALAIAIPVAASGTGFTNIYMLGDSLSDQGNLYEATTALTGGAVGIPRADHYYSGRFSNGENYADILASQLGVALTPSIVDGGNNFAFGGARNNYNTVEVNGSKPFPFSELDQEGLFPPGIYPWTLTAQLGAFIERGVHDPGALYVVFSGSNDLADIITIVGAGVLPGDPTPFIEASVASVIQRIEDVIDTFVEVGAQEILVPNMPNLGVIPGFTAAGPQFAGLATQLTALYNQGFEVMLATKQDSVNIIPLDTFYLLTAAVSEPAAFGFTYGSESCYSGFVGPFDDGEECANPDEYIFWDREHPTTALHTVLAEIALSSFVPDMLDYLLLQVSELDVQEKVRNGLNRKLGGASQKLAEGKDADAVSKLEDFIEAVERKMGKKIPEDDAVSMIMRAEKIIALLNAGQ